MLTERGLVYVDRYSLSSRLMLPLTPRLSIVPRAAVYLWDTKVTVNDGALTATRHGQGFGYTLGIVQWCYRVGIWQALTDEFFDQSKLSMKQPRDHRVGAGRWQWFSRHGWTAPLYFAQ